MSEALQQEPSGEYPHKIELNDGESARMFVSKEPNSDKKLSVSLKAIKSSDSSWTLSAEYDEKIQEVHLNQENYYGQIATEGCICRREMPYINLSKIIPVEWENTSNNFHFDKGEIILKRSNIEIHSTLLNLTFLKEPKKIKSIVRLN